MQFVLGTVVLAGAIALLGFAKHVMTRWDGRSRFRRFAGSETMAVLITSLAAFGIALLCNATTSAQSGLVYVQLAASLGFVLLALIGVIRVFRRAAASVPASMPVGAPL